jgi:hypothetical protein
MAIVYRAIGRKKDFEAYANGIITMVYAICLLAIRMTEVRLAGSQSG